MFIDAKDSVNNWCVAKVTDHDLQNQKIHIHFDGWSARYDEVSTSQYFRERRELALRVAVLMQMKLLRELANGFALGIPIVLQPIG